MSENTEKSSSNPLFAAMGTTFTVTGDVVIEAGRAAKHAAKACTSVAAGAEMLTNGVNVLVAQSIAESLPSPAEQKKVVSSLMGISELY